LAKASGGDGRRAADVHIVFGASGMSRTTRSRVLVDHAAPRRPELAAAIRVRVRVRFVDGDAPVRIDFPRRRAAT
jgi:hypothetical protein